MADEIEEVEYENDDPVSPDVVEVLPPEPVKRQRTWFDWALLVVGGLIAWHVVDRAMDRFGSPSMGSVQAGMVSTNRPVVHEQRPASREEKPVVREDHTASHMIDAATQKWGVRRSELYPFCPPERDECWR